MEKKSRERAGFPPWIRLKLPKGGAFAETRAILDALGLDTVCRGARCPNQARCFARGTATFLVLGSRCTRACRFCSIDHGAPDPPDPDEPRRVAEAVERMGLTHAVVTSVTRDDLPDGGAAHFAAVIRALRAAVPGTTVEVLVPDFAGDLEAVRAVVAAGPDVFNHNVETVPSLYRRVRPQADYARSLAVIAAAKAAAPSRLVKSGLMLGLGEEAGEVEAVLADLKAAGCDLVTLGQYLKPADDCLEPARYVTPDEFTSWGRRARELGFRAAASAPFVRSSYRAADLLSGDPADWEDAP